MEDRVLRFLIEANKTLDGIHIELQSDTPPENCWSISFNAALTCIYAGKDYWTPTDAFVNAIEKLTLKHFGTDQIHTNNTGTCFWINRAQFDTVDNFGSQLFDPDEGNERQSMDFGCKIN